MAAVTTTSYITTTCRNEVIVVVGIVSVVVVVHVVDRVDVLLAEIVHKGRDVNHARNTTYKTHSSITTKKDEHMSIIGKS